MSAAEARPEPLGTRDHEEDEIVRTWRAYRSALDTWNDHHTRLAREEYTSSRWAEVEHELQENAAFAFRAFMGHTVPTGLEEADENLRSKMIAAGRR